MSGIVSLAPGKNALQTLSQQVSRTSNQAGFQIRFEFIGDLNQVTHLLT
jgi:hypothetical protein